MAAVYAAAGLFFAIMAHDDAFADAGSGTAIAAPAVPAPAIASSDHAQGALAELKAGLDQGDRLAVLEAIHVGLTDAPDGATYMWRRNNGKIEGSVRPTASFRDPSGKVCRFIVFQLMLGEHLRQVEGIACRQDDKSWLLEG